MNLKLRVSKKMFMSTNGLIILSGSDCFEIYYFTEGWKLIFKKLQSIVSCTLKNLLSKLKTTLKQTSSSNNSNLAIITLWRVVTTRELWQILSALNGSSSDENNNSKFDFIGLNTYEFFFFFLLNLGTLKN
jgi:hypothetical protein